MIYQPTPDKCCTICKQWFPGTLEYFHKNSANRNKMRCDCHTCGRKRAQEYKRNHPEKIRRKMCEYKQLHPEKIKEHKAKYTKTHPETIKQYQRRYRKENRDKIRELTKQWNQQNPGRDNELHRKWRKANPEKIKEYSHKQRARQRSADGNHTAADIKAQYKHQKGRCYYEACGHASLKKGYHVEHVIPLSRGGSNGPENIVLACPRCNLVKHNRLPSEWPEGGRLL